MIGWTRNTSWKHYLVSWKRYLASPKYHSDDYSRATHTETNERNLPLKAECRPQSAPQSKFLSQTVHINK